MHHAFAHPLLLWLPTLLPLLGVLSWLAWRRRRQALATFAAFPSLGLLLAEQAPLRIIRNLCTTFGLTLLALGMAGPQWGRDPGRAIALGRDVVVVLDLSRSMLAEAPSRLQRGKDALIDMSRAVERRGGHRLGLVVFAGRARVMCPLTRDYDHFRDALERLDAEHLPPELRPTANSPSGTRIGAGIRAALSLFEADYQGFQDIVLVSDGDDPARDDEWRAPAEEARSQHVAIHTVGIGDPTHGSAIPLGEGKQMLGDAVVLTKLEEQPLRDIARISQGTYTAAHHQPPPLAELFREEIEAKSLREDTSDALPVHKQRYALFLGGAFGLLALAVACPERIAWPKRRRKEGRP
jgi:Ca-activated chloride channel family protein